MDRELEGAGPEDARGDFPIVAMGASAGGLEALRQLLSEIPPDTGMAFVVIQHLDPARPSMLASVLGSDSPMPVVEITDEMRLAANRVHVIPPSADLTIRGGIVSLVPREPAARRHLPIDAFFRALAEDQASRAIGVVLSGAASDGTEGLRAIKAAGGITIAQDPASAQFASMPESAIAAGVVDVSLTPGAIARELVRLSRDAYYSAPEPPADADGDRAASSEDAQLRAVLGAIRDHAHFDFRGYKGGTLSRRIARRMALRHAGSLNEYAASLRSDANEAKALAADILIHVTSFFRDPTAFEALQAQVLPRILERKDGDAAVRVWVPGCSTGEEVYSIAICLLEVLDQQRREVSIKIFGSDLSEASIEVARNGVYGEAALSGVTPERLARFFESVDGGARIKQRVRDLCVFVKHDLTRDPPFARLDLISCRNVLIYFDAALQRRVVPLLHHCLVQTGYLFLGRSETLTSFANLFSPVDKTHRIFLKTGASPKVEYPLELGREAESKLTPSRGPERHQPARDAQRHADHILLARFAPPGVVINDRMEVTQFRGRTGDFLEPPPGQPQMNVLKLARPGLVSPLREAIERARAEGATVRTERIRVAEGAHARVVHLEVIPLPLAAERYFLVVFEDAEQASIDAHALPASSMAAALVAPDEERGRLKAELDAARDYLQAIVGEHQDAAEDLAAANEELIAANEELQSTNEELQSAKEELQATNEELLTVNDELRHRNQQLDVLANDLVNVLESVQIPIIMVDQALRIRRFTPTAREISSLRPEDVGRSLDEVKLRVKIDDLTDRVRRCMHDVVVEEWEVQRTDDRWFRLQIRPYRTTDNRLDGAVMSFVEVDALKRAVHDAESARDYSQGIVETVPTSIVVLDTSLRVISANPPFRRDFVPEQAAIEGKPFFELAGGAWNGPDVRKAVTDILETRTRLRGYEARLEFPSRGRRDLTISGAPIQLGRGNAAVLLAIEDVTERRLLEASEKEARLSAEQANRAKDLFLATLSHELRTPLSAILMSAQLLEKATKDAAIQRASATIVRAVGNQARLIDDLLDISRIVSGKLMLDVQVVDLTGVVLSALDVARASADAKGLTLDVEVPSTAAPVQGDPMRLQQIVANLLNNAVKFTPSGGTITLKLATHDRHAIVAITDTGIGLRAELIPHLFDRFVQAESAMTRSHGGLGLGLAIVRHLVSVHGGKITAESPGEGLGATFTVTIPLAPAQAALVTEPRRAVVGNLSGTRVLLVEDDDDTREAYATMIRSLGGEVRAAASAAEGLRQVAAFKPQVILSDIAMPGEDGLSFIRKVRALPEERGGRTPAAALTALAGEEDRRRALEAGFQLHLAKPIDASRLAMAIAALANLAEPKASPPRTPS